MGPEWFQEQRRERGWTKAQCAEFAGVHRSTWGRWESGRLIPKPITIAHLHRRFESAHKRKRWYSYGNWYFRKRHAKGQTQDAAAAAIGVNVSTYRKWETETGKPTLSRAMAIAKWADCSLANVVRMVA